MRKYFAPRHVFSFFLLLFATPSVYAVGDTVPLRKRLVTINVVNQPLREVFARLMNDYDVAIGFEQSPLDNEHDDYSFEVNVPYTIGDSDRQTSPGSFRDDSLTHTVSEGHFITISCQDAPLEDVMDNIVKQMSFYSWKIEDDIVQISPRGGKDAQIEQLMNLRIEKFSLDPSDRIFQIKYHLIDTPEVVEFLKTNNLTVDPLTRVSYTSRHLKEAVTFSGLTFRKLLNSITKIKRGGWMVKRSIRGFDLDLVI